MPCWIALAALVFSAINAHAQPPLPKDSTATLAIEPFAEHTGLNAMDLTHAGDGSGRVFVATQSGQVFAYARDGEALGTFLDLDGANAGFTFDPKPREPFKGLMYIAFHPDYAKSRSPGYGLIYTAHQVTDSPSPADFDDRAFGKRGEIKKYFVIAEWRVDPDNPDRIDPASHRRVMTLVFNTTQNNPHAIGQIKFNPYAQPGEADYGKLYIAVGDGDNGDYMKPQRLEHIQQPDNPFGKILRIDPLPSGDKPYTIPDDNPFDSEKEGQDKTEVYAVGLRDAQWFSFAKDLQGDTVLLSSDIGHLLVEEINVIRPGGNYGWPRYEGTLDFRTDLATLGKAHPPVVHYGHAIPARVGAKPEGGMTAIMGGIVVSDPDSPSFQGQILFGDLPRGTLMHANYHHALTVEQAGKQSAAYITNVKLGSKTGNFADILGTERGDARFGWDQDNAVYIVSKQTDTIYKTNLVYTGLPIESDPIVAKHASFAGTKGLLVTLGGTASLLFLILAAVYYGPKRYRV